MFDNPFGSFQNTVAEAKEEREQLDRLLTISTPRERLLVTVIALLLFVLAAWLFFGNVTRTLAVDGVLVERGENLSGDNRSVQALVWIKRGVAPQIEAGMPATIKLGKSDGETETLDGEVVTISAAPLSGGLATFESAAPVSVHRVVIALGENAELASFPGRKCRIIVELGRQSPIEFFRMRRL